MDEGAFYIVYGFIGGTAITSFIMYFVSNSIMKREQERLDECRKRYESELNNK